MPKATAYCLIWSQEHGTYELSEGHHAHALPLAPGSHEWFAWLATIPSFTFEGQQGQLTVRQEQRPRGGTYWYAYHRAGATMTKRYLGKTSEVTLARLEQVAEALWAAAAGAGTRTRRQETSVLPAALAPNALSVLPAEAEGQGTLERSRPHPGMKQPQDQLLATKLHPPRLRSRLIARTHLTERLQQGMGHGFTLLCAPAGFGKTTLLVQWLAETGMPVAWLSLDPEDNDPVRFLTYVTASLQTLLPELGGTLFRLLEIAPAKPLESAFIVLTNDLVSRQIADVDFALVLDDYHVITTPAIHHALTFL
ncbi:MAG TPA: hypothetical protein VH164_14700, partial [Ktedonobacteraceae bacterium]|nr:hypothetical protein [Ktedonobacteraceae bacterium]